MELPGTSLRSGGKGKKRGTLCTEILKFHRIAHILFFWSRLGRGVGGLLYFWPVRHPSYKNLLNLKYETGSYFLRHLNRYTLLLSSSVFNSRFITSHFKTVLKNPQAYNLLYWSLCCKLELPQSCKTRFLIFVYRLLFNRVMDVSIYWSVVSNC